MLNGVKHLDTSALCGQISHFVRNDREKEEISHFVPNDRGKGKAEKQFSDRLGKVQRMHKKGQPFSSLFLFIHFLTFRFP